jgi:hypothetical protein
MRFGEIVWKRLNQSTKRIGRCGEFVSVITSCWSASSRWAMYLPEKPNAPVTAIRTPASHQADRTSFAREDYALGLP